MAGFMSQMTVYDETMTLFYYLEEDPQDENHVKGFMRGWGYGAWVWVYARMGMGREWVYARMGMGRDPFLFLPFSSPKTKKIETTLDYTAPVLKFLIP